MTDLTTRIQAWLWGRPVHGEVTQHAEQITRMFADLGLVVIDPAEGEQTAALTKALMAANCTAAIDTHAAVKHALRSLITPPRPDEPQGLGAVVEDAEGHRWVRTADADCGKPWSYFNSYTDDSWDQIAAVRVLSEGWSE